MKIDIEEKDLKEAIVKESTKRLLKGEENWLKSYFPLRDLAEEIVKNTPEITEIVKSEIKKLLQDKSFLQSVIREIFINELNTSHDD